MIQATSSLNRRITKKTAAILASFILILTILIAFFVFQFELNDAPNIPEQNQPIIKITDFSINKDWSCVGGLLMDCSFNLTIENEGIVNVTDLVLAVKMFHNDTEIDVGNYFNCTYENGTITQPLNAGEVRTCWGSIMSVVGNEAYRSLRLNSTSVIAFVSLNNTVLDQKLSE